MEEVHSEEVEGERRWEVLRRATRHPPLIPPDWRLEEPSVRAEGARKLSQAKLAAPADTKGKFLQIQKMRHRRRMEASDSTSSSSDLSDYEVDRGGGTFPGG